MFSDLATAVKNLIMKSSDFGNLRASRGHRDGNNHDLYFRFWITAGAFYMFGKIYQLKEGSGVALFNLFLCNQLVAMFQDREHLEGMAFFRK